MEPAEKRASIVLAAGAAKRFGGRKQLAQLHGRPLLEHSIGAALAGPADETVVVLGAYAEEIEAQVDLGAVRVIRCANWETGRGASLLAGLSALDGDVVAALVTLGDEPFVSPDASRRLVARHRAGCLALRATYNGRPGHPVLIDRSLFAALADSASVNPARLLTRAGIVAVECGDLGEPIDIDLLSDLEALEALEAKPRPA